MRIKVTFNQTYYYDPILDKELVETLGPRPTARQIAQYDKEKFVNFEIDPDDFLDRTIVEFEGIDD